MANQHWYIRPPHASVASKPIYDVHPRINRQRYLQNRLAPILWYRGAHARLALGNRMVVAESPNTAAFAISARRPHCTLLLTIRGLDARLRQT